MTDTSARGPGAEGLIELATRRRTVVDEIVLSVPRGGRVVIFADVRMVPGGTDASREASRAIARAVEEFRGPGVVVLAGDVFDLVRHGRPDIDAALAAHPRLAAALVAFRAGPDRRVMVLPGTRDGALAHDFRVVDAVEEKGWEVALGCVRVHRPA